MNAIVSNAACLYYYGHLPPVCCIGRDGRTRACFLALCLCAASSSAQGKLVTWTLAASSVSRSSVVSCRPLILMPCHAQLAVPSRIDSRSSSASPAALVSYVPRPGAFLGHEAVFVTQCHQPWPIPKLAGRFVRFSTYGGSEAGER
ncbi:hypothetical protein CKAH01_13351 [Colletotrichum kahawae]|uniref:Uncharacterized protein n=1 Tax=Colletotrichum kahawae TaxID=34407 RepID=A0AAE0DBM6_COLKA|nr:hypothetical protein CKAH01_13351 [Colletotrichum kahawae]